MKLVVDMPKNRYGGDRIHDYGVYVFRDKGEVWVTIENRLTDDTATQKGGSIWMTPDVANRLGHALVLLSSGDEKGFARDGIQFVVREDESM